MLRASMRQSYLPSNDVSSAPVDDATICCVGLMCTPELQRDATSPVVPWVIVTTVNVSRLRNSYALHNHDLG